MMATNNSALRAAAKNIFCIWCLLCCSISFGQTTILVGPEPGATMTVPLDIGDSTTVRFSTGIYFVPSPIRMSVVMKSAVLEAAPGAQVVLSAGQLITGWQPTTLNRHACVVANLPAVSLGLLNFRELWVNGKRAQRSRFPAKGYLSSVEPADDKIPWNRGQTWFGYKPGDLPDDLPSEAEAIVMNRWEESRLPIASVDPTSHRVNSTRKSVFQLQDGDPYYLEGASQWLQNPGDWYLDHKAGDLYYFPRTGETVQNLQAIVPTRGELLRVDGARNLTIRGITFSHSEWNLPDSLPGDEPVVGGFGQAAIGVSSAVVLMNCQDCKIESCKFEHLGNYALELRNSCKHNVIDHCTFTDLGAGAIRIGETEQRDPKVAQTSGNTVTDCRITDGGHLFPSACGIWIGQSYDNLITHNELADLYYTAISAGWTWGYGPSLCRGNKIEANLIHDIGKKSDGDGPILSDMGAIYTLGARAGTEISGNVFHDITARVYGGWGIYLDEGSSDVMVENNLVYRTTHGGFHLHYGKNNTVQNNIFAFGRDLQIARTRVEPGTMLTFKHNIVYWDTGVFTHSEPGSLRFDENLYRCFGQGKLSFGDKDFDQWKAAGQDVHSILEDPHFTNAAHGDFSLPASSAAEKIHFEPFSLSDAGPRTR